jgi:hypothetical protein
MKLPPQRMRGTLESMWFLVKILLMSVFSVKPASNQVPVGTRVFARFIALGPSAHTKRQSQERFLDLLWNGGSRQKGHPVESLILELMVQN